MRAIRQFARMAHSYYGLLCSEGVLQKSNSL